MTAQKTIADAIASLNAQTPGQAWDAIDGVQSLTSVNRQSSNDVSFNIGSGVLVKGFINTTTGEMRLFPAKLFGYPEVDIN